MARPREPVDLLLVKGNKHLTKSEIEERRQSEVRAESDNVVPPDYLDAKQKKEFIKIADELLRINIMSNLDCDALARYIKARDKYIKYSKMLDDMPTGMEYFAAMEKLDNMQDKSFKQCNAAARELGLTISSRCKLVVPKKEEQPKQNKFGKFGVVNG